MRLAGPRAAWLFAAAVLWPGSSQAQDVTGRWQFTVELDVGAGTPTFEFTQEGEALTGTYQGTFGQAEVTGTVVGRRIDFQFETQGTTATYRGRIDGDTMNGTCNYDEIGAGVWEGVRLDSPPDAEPDLRARGAGWPTPGRLQPPGVAAAGALRMHREGSLLR